MVFRTVGARHGIPRIASSSPSTTPKRAISSAVSFSGRRAALIPRSSSAVRRRKPRAMPRILGTVVAIRPRNLVSLHLKDGTPQNHHRSANDPALRHAVILKFQWSGQVRKRLLKETFLFRQRAFRISCALPSASRTYAQPVGSTGSPCSNPAVTRSRNEVGRREVRFSYSFDNPSRCLAIRFPLTTADASPHSLSSADRSSTYRSHSTEIPTSPGCRPARSLSPQAPSSTAALADSCFLPETRAPCGNRAIRNSR